MISRRDLLRVSAALTGLCGPRLQAQPRPQLRERAEQSARFRLVKQIDQAIYLTVSPDSQRLCVCLTTKPTGKLTLRFGPAQRTVTVEPEPPITITVLEMGSWRKLSATLFHGGPGDFSFFPSGNNLFGSYLTSIPVIAHYVMINQRSGAVEERERSYAPAKFTTYDALRDETLVGLEGQRDLLHAHWPELSDTLRVDAGGHAGIFHFTRDRETAIHLVDQQLVCRRVADFSILWERQVDPEINLQEKMRGWKDPSKAAYVSNADYAISADGSIAVLAPRHPKYEDHPFVFYLEILDGRNGHPMARWPVDFKDGLTLSHYGKLFAIAEAARG